MIGTLPGEPEAGHLDPGGRGDINLRFTLERWCLWQPGASAEPGWPEGVVIPTDSPGGALDFLPVMQRRRLSPLARAAIAVAWNCRGPFRGLPAIFHSRHGESGHYFDMLGDLAQGQELSPSRFSLSVHNAVAGLYSLCSDTRAPCVALAGSGDDLGAAFLEAAGMLAEQDGGRLLLVFYEQPLPDAYHGQAEAPDCTVALGMRLGAATLPGMKLLLTRAAVGAGEEGGSLQALCGAILRGERLFAGRGGWRIELAHG